MVQVIREKILNHLVRHCPPLLCNLHLALRFMLLALLLLPLYCLYLRLLLRRPTNR